MYDEFCVVSEMAYRQERVKDLRRPASEVGRSRRREAADEGRRAGERRGWHAGMLARLPFIQAGR